MSDLIERLRANPNYTHWLCIAEAADRIVLMVTRIAELEAENERLTAKCNQRRDDLKQARDILDERFKRIAELEAKVQVLEEIRQAHVDELLELKTEIESLRKFDKVWEQANRQKDARIEELETENERLTALSLQARADALTAIDDRDEWERLSRSRRELEEENERLTAVYEAADSICNKPIYSKSDEDRLREALAAVEEASDE